MNESENNTQVEESEKASEAEVEAGKAQAAASSSADSDTSETTTSLPVAEVVKSKDDSPKDKSKKASSNKDTGDKKTEEEDLTPPPALKPLPEAQAKLPWYVVHTYSGFEHMVKASIEERIKIKKLDERFGNILIPQETVVELVRGEKKTSTRKFLPGYIVVQMALDDETWHFVCETPKVTGFVGGSSSPMPLLPSEVDNLVKQIEGAGKKAKPKVSFEEGDAVKVVDGPFADFNGTVDDVKPDKGKLRVLISIFGRNTPVELDFVQVEKA